MEEIAMKLASALLAASAFLLFHTALLSPAAAAEPAAPEKTSGATYDCQTTKATVTTCKRQISQDLKKQCRWKCSTSKRIEICRGSGQECNGKTPPGW
jgi:hypothetical protein